MSEPIKIIFRYKNNNRKFQYHTYIFVGDMVSDEIKQILEDIQEQSFYDMITGISKRKYDIMSNFYGEFWYKYFYNVYHISSGIKNIIENKVIVEELIKKFSKDWFLNHITEYKMVNKKVYYTYNKRYYLQGNVREEYNENIEKFKIQNTITYRKKQDKETKMYYYESKIQGGDDEEDEEEDDLFEEFYKEDITDIQEVIETSKEVEDTLDKKNIYKKQIKNMIEFNESDMNTTYREQLQNVYKKYYIYDQYIYYDDKIITIKEKICLSIRNSNQFASQIILPEYQYLWLEYLFGEVIEKVSIDHLWLYKNQILETDVESDENLNYYTDNSREIRDLINLFKTNNKLRLEDMENKILSDYDEYFMNNEIFMFDLFNEIGHEVSLDNEKIGKLKQLYMKLYFPKINSYKFDSIIELIKGESLKEKENIDASQLNIMNENIISNDIIGEIEKYKIKDNTLFNETNLMKLMSYVYILPYSLSKLDLYQLYNNFKTSEVYPFIQYNNMNNTMIFKLHEETINNEFKNNNELMKKLYKWFEGNPDAITIKMRMNEQFITVKISELGKVEITFTWPESAQFNISQINFNYSLINELIMKIGDENSGMIKIPEEYDYRIAFMNSIQKYNLPNNHNIDHNTLSDFSRLFFPYIALIIDPTTKKKKKGEDFGKWGTYLMYKRISNYNLEKKIRKRIIMIMKNYEYTEEELFDVLSRNYNMNKEEIIEMYKDIKLKYKNIKRSRNILLKISDLKKDKLEGIRIELVGKRADEYKIKIMGSTSIRQLKNITTFLNKFLMLYYDVYVSKKEKYLRLLDKLEDITDIAKRLRIVNDYVKYETTELEVKKTVKTDEGRLGKKKANDVQYARLCQNSGNMRKRPFNVEEKDLDKYIKKGYKYNEKKGYLEKKVKTKDGEETIKMIKLDKIDKDGNKIEGENIYYACDPDNNGEYIHVGFLTQIDRCLPCCFKKDFEKSSNKNKQEKYKTCMSGENKSDDEEKEEIKEEDSFLEKVYVLQYEKLLNKGKVGYLPRYLDFYINIMLGKTKEIKNHYLTNSENGYYFKIGVERNTNNFLNCISFCIGIELEVLIQKIVKKIDNDIIFAYLDNGNIKLKFKTQENYIRYIQESENISVDSVYSILNVLGYNIFLFDEMTKIIKKDNHDIQINDSIPILLNYEEIEDYMESTRKNIVVVKENNIYYPIIFIKKTDRIEYQTEFVKTDNIVPHLYNLFEQNMKQKTIMEFNKLKITGKQMYKILRSLGYNITHQILDVKVKCKYFILDNGCFIPVYSSGCLKDIPILRRFESRLMDFKKTYETIHEIYTKSNNDLNFGLKGVYYDKTKSSDNKILITAILLDSGLSVPVQEEEFEKSKIEKYNLEMIDLPLANIIDKILDKEEHKEVKDSRILEVRKNKYLEESYQLFKLEFSHFIRENPEIKENIRDILRNDNSPMDKRLEIRKYIFSMSSPKMEKLLNKLVGGSEKRFIQIIDKLPDLSNYEISNTRKVCSFQHKCSEHCVGEDGKCSFALTTEMLIKFVYKISDELVFSPNKNSLSVGAKEILFEDNYNISDIVDRNFYEENKGEIIIRGSSINLKQKLEDIFGVNEIPLLNKKNIILGQVLVNQMNIDNPPQEFKQNILQEVISNKNTLYRAVSNCIYWLVHSYIDNYNRNLGYFSERQTDISYYLKNKVIEYAEKQKNKNLIRLISLSEVNQTDGLIEFEYLHKITQIPIIIFNEDEKPIYLFNNNEMYSSPISDNRVNDIKRESINLIVKYTESGIINKIVCKYYKNG